MTIRTRVAHLLDGLRRLVREFPFLRALRPRASTDRFADLDQKLVLGLAKKRLPAPDQLRFLGRVLNHRERRLAAIFGLAFLVATLALGVRFYKRHVVLLPKAGGTYTEVVVGMPQYINPVISAGNDVDQDLVQLIYSPLFKLGPGPLPEPDLVREYVVSEDGKVYTLTLRDDVRFQDGEPLTANDVAFTFELIQQKEYKSPLRNAFRTVKVEVVDDRTIRLTLAEPSGPFLSTLTFGILPEHLWRDVLPANLTLVEQNLKPIGSGPYQFSKLVRTSAGQLKSYTLVRNDGYYGALPYLDQITFRFANDAGTAWQMLKDGQAEGVHFLAATDLTQASGDDDLRLVSLAYPQFVSVSFNQNNGVLKRKDVRLALAQSVDRQALATLAGAAVPAQTPFLPMALGGDAGIAAPALDPAAAEATLEAAGWKRTEGEAVRKNGSTALAFTLTTVEQGDYVAVANRLKEEWAAIGAAVEVKVVDPGTAQRDVLRPRQYDALLFGEISGADPDPYPFWHSSQVRDPGLNLAVGFRKDIDTVLEDARKATDPQARAAKYAEFQRLFVDELPAIVLYRPLYTYGLARKVHGFETSWIVSPRDRFNDVASWYTQTRRTWK